jgi:putative peptidoglycan lipid II flippase
MIFGVTVLSPRFGIQGLAWGVLLGAGLHLLLQIPLLIRQGGSFILTLGLRSREVREVARLMGPRLLGVAVVQLNFWINVRLASLFPEGSVTAIQIAFALMLMPQAAIAQSIATAALPTFSAQVAQNKMGEMRSSLSATLRGILLLSIPASLGLILLRVPIITMLYQRGEFTAQSTQLVAWALLWYAAGLVGHALVEILARAFYALHDTKTPVFIGIAAMTLNVVFSYLFTAWFARLGWMPHGGLALANTLATALEMIGLLVIMGIRLKGFDGKLILTGLYKAGFSGVVMGAALWSWIKFSGDRSIWIQGGVGILIGMVLYTLMLWLVNTGELKQLYQVLKSRLAS